jgi:hypothetical protein
MAQPQEIRRADVTVLHEIDLGQHHLFLMSDRSIDLMRDEEAVYVAENVISLNSGETYHLLVCLQELFKDGNE